MTNVIQSQSVFFVRQQIVHLMRAAEAMPIRDDSKVIQMPARQCQNFAVTVDGAEIILLDISPEPATL